MHKQPSSIISAAPASDSFATCPCKIFFKGAYVWEQENTNI